MVVGEGGGILIIFEESGEELILSLKGVGRDNRPKKHFRILGQFLNDFSLLFTMFIY